jgi:hypothetical protein
MSIGNGNVSGGFSEGVALRREQCDVRPKIRNLGITEMLQRSSLLQNGWLKHVPIRVNE